MSSHNCQALDSSGAPGPLLTCLVAANKRQTPSQRIPKRNNGGIPIRTGDLPLQPATIDMPRPGHIHLSRMRHATDDSSLSPAGAPTSRLPNTYRRDVVRGCVTATPCPPCRFGLLLKGIIGRLRFELSAREATCQVREATS